MNNITYKVPTDIQFTKGVERNVFLDNKKIGSIFRRPNTCVGPHDFQYVPAGKTEAGGGELYSTLAQCKRSIEGED